MTEQAKRKAVLIMTLITKFVILLLAVGFVLYYNKEFFGIAATGSVFERMLLVPSLVFVLRMSIVIFLAVAFGFLVMILFKDIEGFKIGSWEVQFTKQTSESSETKITEIAQANKELSKEVEMLKTEKEALLKNLRRLRRMRGDKK